MQRATSFRLSEDALKRLAELQSVTGLSGGKVLEGLLLGQYGIRERLFMVGTQWTADEQAKMEDRPPLHINKLPQTPPVEAVKEKFETVSPSAEKRVQKTIDTPAKQAVQQVRRRTTLTGQPFGPIPKGK